MSGICGILHPEGLPVERREIYALLKPLSQRGPDGSHATPLGKVALGHALLATTPEAENETQPLTHEASGCAITADVRLDNREELAEALGLPDHGSHCGDAGLILAAYLKWSFACLDRLRGDFAFAIWDPRKDTLFCARDQVGMRQLIWHHHPGRIFAFATEARSLLCHPHIHAEIDEGRIGDYIENLEAHDLSATFFTGLHRLPPAHALTVCNDSVRTWRYWSAPMPTPLRLGSDAEYAEAFLEVFTSAVRSRLRSQGPVGATLSGGMDSGSVAAVAGQLLAQAGLAPLRTFSAITDDPDCVESNAIRVAMGLANISPSSFGLDDLEIHRDELLRLTEGMGEPFDGQMTLPRAVYFAAHKAGVKVMLDGVGGDTTLGSEPMVAWYLERGKPIRALREARGEAHFWGKEADGWRDHARSLVRALAPKGWLAARQARYLESKLERAGDRSPLDPEFAARIAMARRRRDHAEQTALPADPETRRVHRILHPNVVVARERYDRTAAQLAIEPRDPFLDLRLINFVLSLPQDQLQDGGWPKIILRRAMKDHLPDTLRWRVGKEHLGGIFSQALWYTALLDTGRGKDEQVQRFLKQEAIPVQANADYTTTGFAHTLHFRYLDIWLKQVNQ